jgi:hypothetical protein
LWKVVITIGRIIISLLLDAHFIAIIPVRLWWFGNYRRDAVSYPAENKRWCDICAIHVLYYWSFLSHDNLLAIFFSVLLLIPPSEHAQGKKARPIWIDGSSIYLVLWPLSAWYTRPCFKIYRLIHDLFFHVWKYCFR